jgi:trehalose 2-sulfotransferase
VTGAPARFVADLLGPEHDSAARAESLRALRSYVVCSTPRSGSGLLCRGLAAVGGVGVPLEYFNPLHRSTLVERWRCGPGLQPYLDALHARRGGGGVFAAKLHWEQMAQLLAEAGAGGGEGFDRHAASDLIDRVFPAPRFVRIVRLDLDRQAVSYWRALSSNVWSVGAREPASVGAERVSYSFEGIARCRRLIEDGARCWERLIHACGGDAVLVTYEELAEDFADTIARVAERISPGLAPTVTAPSTRRLSDEHSLELLERFRRERAVRAA